METIHIYYKRNGKKADTVYKHVQAIRAGSAAEILGNADADGNGIPRKAPLLQIVLDDGTTATYNADDITILFD